MNPQIRQILDRHRLAIQAAARHHGVVTVRVFGSVARGEDDPESDIDFLVEMEQGRSLLDLGGCQVEMEELLGRSVDVMTPACLRPRVRERAEREAIPL